MKFKKGHKTNLGKKFPNRKSPPPFTEEHKRKIGLNGFHYGMLGKKQTKEVIEKRRLSSLGKHSGNKCPFWKGGISPLRRIIRTSFKYRQWLSDVLTKDDFTCQKCNKRGGKLSAHHIKSFAKIITEYEIKTLEQANDCAELWNINNGQTLCIDCHKKTDNYGKNIIKD